MKKNNFFRKMNNRGAGVVAVIVAIALVSILVSVVLSTSYANFKMKQTNYKSKNNFYSAEKALDEINVGLQGYISEALSYSYLEIMSIYGELDTADDKRAKMEDLYYQQLWKRLATDSTDKFYKVDVLYNFVTEKWDDSTQTGALVTSETAQMVTYSGKGIVLKGVEVYYKDDAGYSTLITTDIRLACPELQFGSSSAMPDIMNYALVANQGLVFETSDATNTVEGQLYAKFITAEGNSRGEKMKLNFVNNSIEDSVFNLVSKGNINLKYVDATFPEQGTLWAKGINLDSSSAVIGGVNAEKGTKGSSYVSDDLVLNGKSSFVKIKGDYYGYGNSASEAGKSSSIIVNGTDSEIDLTGCENIELAGHAFIGTKAVQSELTTAEYSSIESTGSKDDGVDVLTGESIAVKSNQLLYLVPADAIGVDINKVSHYHKNPLTKEEYKTNVNEHYVEYNKDYVIFGAKTLGYYAENVIKVFIPSGKTTMVYYYLNFNSLEKANEFFADYFEADYKQIEKYFDFYTKMIKVPDTLNLVRFTTAGNILSSKDPAEINVSNPQKYNMNENNVIRDSATFNTKYDLRENQKKALCTRLITRYEDFEATELEKCVTQDVIFKNLVAEDKFTNYLADATKCPGKTLYFTVDNESNPSLPYNKAVLIDGNFVYKSSENPEMNLIIASGNVTVESNFTGLIIAGGIVTVKPGVTIKKDDVLTKKAFRLQKVISGDIISPISFMIDGDSVLSIEGSVGEGANIVLSDMVIYENWNKE